MRYTLLAIVLAAIAAKYWNGIKRFSLPSHMLGHPAIFEEGLLSEEMGGKLMDLMKEMGEFPTNVNDLQFYTTKHEHIGEARPTGPNGECNHPYLVPSSNGSLCILPGRIDIGRHFMKGGGIDGLREPYEVLVARLLSFGAYNFNLGNFPVTTELFGSGKFQEVAKKVCPASKQFLDPFQFNFIIQAPGQSVAMHIDGVYFWGATRFQFPQWLLAAMKFSGLFEDKFVNQVQVVGYLHRWEPTDERAGRFIYYDENDPTPKEVPPTPLAGSAIDGSKTVHSARVYRPGSQPPILDKSRDNRLVYIGENQWVIESEGKGIFKLTTDDLRVSIVYRARCFEDEAETKRFHDHLNDDSRLMKLEDVLTRLSADMVSRGVVSSVDDAMAMPRLNLALLIMDTYITYPLAQEPWIPLNYCMLKKVAPWTGVMLDLVC